MKQIEDGREPPPQFYEQPELDVELMIYLEAFRELSTERQIGMSLGPIPRSQLHRYADELDLHGDEHDRFCSIISLIDVDYILMISEPKSATVAQSDQSMNKQLRNVVTLDNKAGILRLLNRVAKKKNGRS